jgi:hypothetical protein
METNSRASELMPKASEIRKTASKFDKDIYSLKPEYELWGTCSGSTIPYHRKWWILKGDEIIAHLDQGCYQDGQIAGAERTRWARSLGLIGK